MSIPIHQSRSEEIRDALIEHMISTYSIPEYIIMDQDSACMSMLIKNLFKKIGIKFKMFAPYNHQSLSAEHGNRSLATWLMKPLTGLGQYWKK